MAIISFWWDIEILLLTICGLGILWAHRRYKYWKNRGIEGPEPTFFFGNIKDMITLKSHLGENFMDLYNRYKSSPFIGIFMLFRPTLVLNDLELIKQILVKDFNSFTDHLMEFDPKYEQLGDNLFNVTGERWKMMRHKLTPTFTSNKMKYMFETLKNCSTDLEKYLDKITAENDTVSVKDFLSCFGINVIGTCAFGVECNAFENPDSKFIKFGSTLFRNSKVKAIFQNCLMFELPDVTKNLKFSLLGKETNEFFYNLVKDTIEYRNKNNISRNDFLQILMELQQDEADNGKHDDGTRLTTMQLAAQCFIFFVAGFETSSTSASFALYELAMNPDVQENAREEIQRIMEKNNGSISYECLSEMTYLTKVIEETLRKYPPFPVLFRTCTKDYKMPDTDLVIPKGLPLMIPVYGIQKDPQYYPDPEKFDPERFSPENKASRHHFAYLPFGEGPRICIGSRFGMMQIKLGLVTVLSKYKVSTGEKTVKNIELDSTSLLMCTKHGIWLKLTKLNK